MSDTKGVMTVNKKYIVVTTLNQDRFVAHLESGAALIFDIKTESRIIIADDAAKKNESKFKITKEELDSIMAQLDDTEVEIISVNLS